MLSLNVAQRTAGAHSTIGRRWRPGHPDAVTRHKGALAISSPPSSLAPPHRVLADAPRVLPRAAVGRPKRENRRHLSSTSSTKAEAASGGNVVQ